MTNYDQLLPLAKSAALEAGAAIMSIYNSDDFQTEYKQDNSPLTKADRLAHEIIEKALAQTNLPLLCEEGRDIPFEERKNWETFWLVDPLDGTKEFVKKNGEFTVNIALINNHQPILGVIYPPVLETLYWGAEGLGAWRQDKAGGVVSLKCEHKKTTGPGLRVVTSRSHLNDATQEFLSGLQNPTLVSMGSSLKIMLLAQSDADIYPRLAPTMEWDTAAAHAILREAGGQIINQETNEPMEYNKENLLNPFFIASC